MNKEISLVYKFAYLIKIKDDKIIKLKKEINDDILDTGLAILPNNNKKVNKVYFIGNNFITKQLEQKNIVFKKNKIIIEDMIFSYSDLEINIIKDAVYLSINDIILLELNTSLINLLEESKINLISNTINFKILIDNNLLYLENNRKIDEINLLDNYLEIGDSIDNSYIYCNKSNKKFLLQDCFIKCILEDNKSNIYIQVEDDDYIFTLGYV